MSKPWTDNQKKAIKARGMQVLVSAAAGSGKTAVLTERVKNIICDTENKCSVSEILVVTFTRAAAAEMRDRIYAALEEAALKDPENNDYLRKQMALLPTADICTMDSFCAKIVRENFSLADIGSDFKILDNKDSDELLREMGEEIINEFYESDNEDFKLLSRLFLDERDDKLLFDIIKKLYEFSLSYPSPELWLDELLENFSQDKTPTETVWSDIIFKHISLICDYHRDRLLKCVPLLENSGNFKPEYIQSFILSADSFLSLKNAADGKSWDLVIDLINKGITIKVPSRNTNIDKDLKKFTDAVFKSAEEESKALADYSLPDEHEHSEDCKLLYPVVRVLCDCVKTLSQRLESAKKERNAYTFSDIMHKCIDLLCCFDGEKWIQKPLALNYVKQYKEILIDEYQDTNEAQNKIFETISRDKSNIYVVGDVKQSIYKFRLASPQLFMSLMDTLELYDGTEKPSRIILDSNFRSRKGITEAVNFLFERVMSRNVGEIDYNGDELLRFGAKYYPEKDTPDTEVVCIKLPKKSDIDYFTEADAIAHYIKKIVESGVTVGPEDKLRKVSYGDFCILLRSAKGKIPTYAEALKKLNIPVSALLEDDSSKYKEIQFLISLINVVNNPLMDIPLIAVLSSPVFGFVPDELSQIRMIDRKADFYTCLVKYAESSQKAKSFLDKIILYRNISATYTIDEFVEFIINDTAVEDIYFVAGSGSQRKANIRGFKKAAIDFTQGGRSGLSDFVRYIDNAANNEGLSGLNSDFVDENSVKIMSIHKSKGLEFPYVIIADCNKKFNTKDLSQPMTVSRETGIGLKIRDDELFTKYHTVSSVATELAIKLGAISEELRVLYVAMTRAKEHLTFFCSSSTLSFAKKVKQNTSLSIDCTGKLHPYAIFNASSYAEIILSVYAIHRDGGEIRSISDNKTLEFLENVSFGLDVAYYESLYSFCDDEEETEESSAIIDYDFIDKVKSNVEFEYPYDYQGLLAKRTASSTEKSSRRKEFFISRKPGFLSDDFSGAHKGTAVHKFLELCDFHLAAADILAEKDRLRMSGRMTEKELSALDNDAVRAFLDSDIGRRILNSETVYKEYEFSVLRPAEEFYGELPQYARDEQIVVQGKLDCAFIENGKAVLIDYKTDNITDEDEYRRLYTSQLSIYADALTQCTGFSVEEKYIYSFKLKRFILI